MKLDDIHQSMFTATKWDQPTVKLKYTKRLCRFLERRCPKKSWNKAFYNRLSQMFGFIAHYDVYGFWETRLESPQKRLTTLRAISAHPCYGSPEHTWSDAERVVQAFVKTNGLLEVYEQEAQESLEKAEKAKLAELQEKYSQ